MGARNRLNGAFLTGSLLAGTAIAIFSGSLMAGFLVFTGLTIIDMVAGNIRLASRGLPA